MFAKKIFFNEKKMKKEGIELSIRIKTDPIVLRLSNLNSDNK